MSVFAINCTIEPGGLGPALLVFGALSRLAKMTSAATHLEMSSTSGRSNGGGRNVHARRKLAY